jgi:hypothetical protein
MLGRMLSKFEKVGHPGVHSPDRVLPLGMTSVCRLLCRLFVLIIINGFSPELMADEPPTFVIDGETFNVQQANVYKLGIFDQELTDDDIIKKLQTRDYELEFGAL